MKLLFTFASCIALPSFLFSQQIDSRTSIHQLEVKIDSLTTLRGVLTNRVKELDELILAYKQMKFDIEYQEVSRNLIIVSTRQVRENIKVRLRSGSHPTSETLKIVPPTKKLIALDYYRNYWNVDCDGTVGYISDMFITSDARAKQFAKAREQMRSKEKRELRQQQSRIESNKIWIKTLKANIREFPSAASRIMSTLEIGDLVYLQEETGDWFRVMWKKSANTSYSFADEAELLNSYELGWIHKSLTSETEVGRSTKNVLLAQERRKLFVQNNSHIEDRVKTAILKGRVMLGMTNDMATASWGDPEDTNRTVGSFGVHEQWIYGNDIEFRKYLYFENGILTSWQE